MANGLRKAAEMVPDCSDVDTHWDTTNSFVYRHNAVCHALLKLNAVTSRRGDGIAQAIDRKGYGLDNPEFESRW
jgi:hypothetical protein